MAIIIRGFAQSSYVWTARAGLNLRKIEHEFLPIQSGDNRTPEYLKKNPFGKVPIAEIDGKVLFETTAILRWADATGSGTALFPKDAWQAAQVEQWLSAINAYYYPPIVLDYVLKYIFAGPGGPDRAAIDKAVPILKERVSYLNGQLGDPWLVGGSVSAADLLAGPLLMGLTMFPEGQEILAANPKVGRLLGALKETPEFISVAPSP